MCDHNFPEIPLQISADVTNRIVGADQLIAWFNGWPTFADAEVVRIQLDRGNSLVVFETKDWDKRVPQIMTVEFHLFDSRHPRSSPQAKAALATIRFLEIDELHLCGFNYQNPMIGCGIRIAHSDRLKRDLFLVSWGGTALQHDVSLSCGAIEVHSVQGVVATGNDAE